MLRRWEATHEPMIRVWPSCKAWADRRSQLHTGDEQRRKGEGERERGREGERES